jgi:hypothetical protein
MAKELFQFIFFISAETEGEPAEKSRRNHGKPSHGAYLTALYHRLRQTMALLQFRTWSSVLQAVLLAGIIGLSFPMHARATEVTLAWDDNNPIVDGYQIFQRAEGQAYDFSRPAWPTDGRDHSQNSCTIADLTPGVQYYFVVRAYAGKDQSAVSNEVTFVAPDPSTGTIADGNHPPEQPRLTSIVENENDVSLTPVLTASEFDDPDTGDSHAGTEWRILLANDKRQVVFDRTSDNGRLSKIRIPHMVLEPSTAYSAQVRFFDAQWNPSPWSQPVAFTTAADANDRNKNNVPDNQEIRTPMDLNGDAISDLDQTSVVKSLFTYDEQHMIGISVELNDPAVQIQAAASIAPSAIASSDPAASQSTVQMPYGLLGCRIKVEPGEIIAVQFNLSDPLSADRTQWVRYDEVDGMSGCEASTDMEDSGLVVNRYLVDGGDEDADGVANGVIVDLSGPREVEASDSSLAISNDGPAAPGGSSGGCFIRTLF